VRTRLPETGPTFLLVLTKHCHHHSEPITDIDLPTMGVTNADVLLFNIASFIAGLFLLEYGADKFIDHTAIVAKQLNVSPTLIGLLTCGAEWEEVSSIPADIRTPITDHASLSSSPLPWARRTRISPSGTSSARRSPTSSPHSHSASWSLGRSSLIAVPRSTPPSSWSPLRCSWPSLPRSIHFRHGSPAPFW